MTYKKVYPYVCKRCGKKRQTTNKELAASEGACAKCNRTKPNPKQQQLV